MRPLFSHHQRKVSFWHGTAVPARSAAGVAQPLASRAHVPEMAVDEVAATGIVMQHVRKRRIGMRLRLALTEASQLRDGAGNARFACGRKRKPRCGSPRAACRTAAACQATLFARPNCRVVWPTARSSMPQCCRSQPRPGQSPGAPSGGEDCAALLRACRTG